MVAVFKDFSRGPYKKSNALAPVGTERNHTLYTYIYYDTFYNSP